MPLNLFYTMMQKSQKWPKTQIKGGGGSCLKCTEVRERKSTKFLHKRKFLRSQ